MLALHHFLAGHFTNPFAYGASRLIITMLPSLTIGHLSGVLFWEAWFVVVLAGLYWMHRVIQLTYKQEQTRVIDETEAVSQDLATLCGLSAARSKSPR